MTPPVVGSSMPAAWASRVSGLSPVMLVSPVWPRGSAGVMARASAADQDDTPDQQRHADQAGGVDRALGEHEPAEVVEGHRRKHLARDEEGDEGRRPELRHEQDGEADED